MNGSFCFSLISFCIVDLSTVYPQGVNTGSKIVVQVMGQSRSSFNLVNTKDESKLFTLLDFYIYDSIWFSN